LRKRTGAVYSGGCGRKKTGGARGYDALVLTYLIPVFVLGGLLLLMATFAVLSRVRGGRYVRPVLKLLMKVPLFKRLLTKASRAALERQNPELASAIGKLERAGALKDPLKAQAALSRLTAAERRAWLDAAADEGAMQQMPTNRAARRQQRKLQGRRPS
jgi:hypothetical protein